jgi:hypothetical protein
MYIKKDIQYKLRNDIAIFHEGEFESIFIETIHPNAKSVIVREMYRTPNTNAPQSVNRYYEIISKLVGSMPIIIGTDQNFDFLTKRGCMLRPDVSYMFFYDPDAAGDTTWRPDTALKMITF